MNNIPILFQPLNFFDNIAAPPLGCRLSGSSAFGGRIGSSASNGFANVIVWWRRHLKTQKKPVKNVKNDNIYK